MNAPAPALHHAALSDASGAGTVDTFDDLQLPEPLRRAIADLGFTLPSPIQAEAIPALLAGRDITGVAATGTGKTAAFGLPLLAAVDPTRAGVQALVLTPTRELAMQVAAAITSFAAHLPGMHVVSVYGGAPFLPQRSALARGAQVVVGTPGRIIDHLDRRTLDLAGLRFLVLDEADEMLRMGFAEDVDRILSEAPSERQSALFSATMPAAIRKVARTHLRRPVDITMATKAATTTAITQSYAVVPFRQKVDALCRVLEMSGGDATIVFVRTKSACDEVGAALAARGVSSAALNGDVPQRDRERIVERLRSGAVDVLVATDVAARGLDVERVDLVVNFDAPREAESYVHRIGRTGRAGRTGSALTFFTPREVFQVKVIERATGGTLRQITTPTAEDVARHRMTAVLASAQQRVGKPRIADYRSALSEFAEQQSISIYDAAAALLALACGDDGAPAEPPAPPTDRSPRAASDRREPRRRRADGPVGPKYRVEVGRRDGVRPAGIVGAITGEGGINGKDLGKIDIFDTFSVVEIGTTLTPSALRRISRATVSGRQLRIEKDRPAGRRQDAHTAPRRSRPTVRS